MSKDSHRVRYTLVAGVLLTLAGVALVVSLQGRVALARGGHGASGSASTAVPTPDPFTQALMANLEQNGFQVSQGYPKLYTFQDCIDHTYPKLKNRFGANPAAPYVIAVMKSWPNEYVDPAMANTFVETDPGYSTTYRLDPREAIVIYGEMPPQGKYMGLQTWEFSRHGKWKAKDYNQWANTPDLAIPIEYLFETISPDDPKSQRPITFSALGDIVNNVVMERQLHNNGYVDDDPFGKTLYFIITPSAATDNAARLALQAQGVPNGYIFTEQIPRRDDLGPIGPIGTGKNAIDFATWFRYALPDDPAAAELWRENLPLTVLRVRAPALLGPVQRYKSLTFEPRNGISEAGLAGDLQDLVDAVCSSVSSSAGLTSTDCGQQQQPASSFMPDLVRDYGWIGPCCRLVGMDCLGDQQDAAYFAASPRSVDSGQVYAIVGTLATETGNATYVGLSANNASTLGGVPNATLLDTDLKGSADFYAPVGNPTKFSKFFVHYFTTDCSNVPGRPQDCTEITDDMLPPATDTSAMGYPALHGMILVSLRDYIAPGTERGPDSSKLLTPRILTFTPQ